MNIEFQNISTKLWIGIVSLGERNESRIQENE